MKTVIPLEDVAAKLPAMIETLRKGDEIVVTNNENILARVVGERTESRPRPKAGFLKGIVEIVSEDEDHLKDFAEHMQ
jgi:antitoxin (DNA-binding transcriptional repressor) of toxin-antitoxin stability system